MLKKDDNNKKNINLAFGSLAQNAAARKNKLGKLLKAGIRYKENGKIDTDRTEGISPAADENAEIPKVPVEDEREIMLKKLREEKGILRGRLYETYEGNQVNIKIF